MNILLQQKFFPYRASEQNRGHRVWGEEKGGFMFAGHRESLQATQLWVERTEPTSNSETLDHWTLRDG